MTKTPFVSLLLCIVLCSAAYGDIYKYVDENGVTHFTNVPKGSEYEKVIESNTDPSPTNFDYIIRQKSVKYDIEPSIIKAVIEAESNWDDKAVSKKGAIGLMQLMPATARDMQISNRYDPEQNIEAGTRYLKMLLERFNGDMELAVAAYNAGPTNVEKSGGIPSFSETKKFVRNVISTYKEKSDESHKRIYKVMNDDGTVVYTNIPSSDTPSAMSDF